MNGFSINNSEDKGLSYITQSVQSGLTFTSSHYSTPNQSLDMIKDDNKLQAWEYVSWVEPTDDDPEIPSAAYGIVLARDEMSARTKAIVDSSPDKLTPDLLDRFVLKLRKFQ